MISEAAPQSVIGLPVAEQPHGLPAEWSDYPLEDQATYLRLYGGEVPLNTYVSVGLEVGARRMDALTPGDNVGFHTQSLIEQSFSPVVAEAYRASQDGDDGCKYTKLDEPVLAQVLREHFDAPLVNPVVFRDLCERSRRWGNYMRSQNRVSATPFNVMIDVGWENSLLALAAAQGLTQAASKKAREFPRYALGQIEEVPTVAKSFIDEFWQNKLIEQNSGVVFFMGYHAMARAVTVDAMRQRWDGEDYADTRQTFITAINISVAHLRTDLERSKVRKRACEPAFESIRDGNFPEARACLAQAATYDPNLFTSIGLRHLLGSDQGSISGRDMLK